MHPTLIIKMHSTWGCLWRITEASSYSNIAARLLAVASWRDHITLVLQEHHWFPIGFHVKVKLLVMNFKTLHVLVPGYLMDHIYPVWACAAAKIIKTVPLQARAQWQAPEKGPFQLWHHDYGTSSTKRMCLIQCHALDQEKGVHSNVGEETTFQHFRDAL